MHGIEHFVRILPAAVAAQTQAIAGQAVNVADAQHAILLKGIDFAVDDLAVEDFAAEDLVVDVRVDPPLDFFG